MAMSLKGAYIETPCPCCDSRNYLVYKKIRNCDTFTETFIKEKHISICKNCGFIFQNPRFKKGLLNKIYRKMEDKVIYDDDNLNIQIKNLAIAKINILKKIRRKGRILEIGCSEGYFLKLAQKSGYEVAGIDPSTALDRYRGKIARDIKIFNVFFESYKSNDRYDIIMHNFVLEHVCDPLLFLRKCRCLIKENGIMLFEVPDVTKFKNLPFAIDLFPYQHISHFTHKILTQLLDKSGWQVNSIDGNVDFPSRNYGMSVLARPRKINNSNFPLKNFYNDSKKMLDIYFDSLEANKKKVIDSINDIIDRAIGENKDIGIMGTGENCRFIVENTDILKKSRVHFYDSNPALWGKRFCGKAIKSPSKIPIENLSVIILASIEYQNDMAAYLLSLGVKKSLLRYMYKNERKTGFEKN